MIHKIHSARLVLGYPSYSVQVYPPDVIQDAGSAPDSRPWSFSDRGYQLQEINGNADSDVCPGGLRLNDKAIVTATRMFADLVAPRCELFVKDAIGKLLDFQQLTKTMLHDVEGAWYFEALEAQ